MSFGDDEENNGSSFFYPKNVEDCNKLLQQEHYGYIKICLGKSSISEEQSSLLSSSLSTAKNLTHFFLVYTKLNAAVLENVLNKGLRKCHSLFHLDLTGNKIGDAGAAVVGDFIRKNRTITILHLDSNEITTEGAQRVAEGLEFNRYLAILTMVNNKLDKGVIRSFLAALKLNRYLVGLELGNVESSRVQKALKNNELFREVVFDNVLSKPHFAKTRFNTAKINVIGEKECGKSRALEGLITNTTINKEDLRNARKATVNSVTTTNLMKHKNSVDNYPKISIRRVKAISKLNFWEERFDNLDPSGCGNVDYVTENSMRTAAMLANLKTQDQKTQEAERLKELQVEKVKRKQDNGEVVPEDTDKSDRRSRSGTLLSQLSLRRKKSRKQSNATSSTGESDDNDLDDDYMEIRDQLSKKSTIHSVTSMGTSSLRTLRKTGLQSKGHTFSTMRSISINNPPVMVNETDDNKSTYQDTLADGLSMFNLEEAFANNARATSMSLSTTTTDSSDSEGENKKSSFEDVLNKIKKEKQKKEKLEDFEIEKKEGSEFPETVVDETSDLGNEIDLDEYVRQLEIDYDPFETSPRELVLFQRLRKDYQDHLDKKEMLQEANRKTKKQSVFSNAPRAASRKFEGDDLDGNLRAFSLNTFRDQEKTKDIEKLPPHMRKGAQAMIFKKMSDKHHSRRQSAKSGPHRPSVFSSQAANGQRRSRLPNPTASVLMRREFSDKLFMTLKTKSEGVNLNFWEFSDNYYYDSMFCGMYRNLMAGDFYGITMICFDLSRMLRSKSHGRKSLVYYLKLANTKPEAKIVIVGTKLDKIKSHQDLSNINMEVKKALKESDTKSVLMNSKARLFFFAIDSVRNFGISELRMKLDRLARALEPAQRKISLKDFCLLDALTCDKHDEEGKILTSLKFDEVRFWAEKLDVSRAQLDNLMKLFHESGILMHFPKMRSIGDAVLLNVNQYITNMCMIFNPEILNQSYNTIYNDNDLESVSSLENINTYRRNFLVSRSMIENMCDKNVDKDVLISFLQECALLTEWIFDTELFFKGLDLRNKIKAQDLDSDVLFLPTLLNDKNTVSNYKKMKRKTQLMTEQEEEETEEEYLKESQKYLIDVEFQEKSIFPSAYFATFAGALVKFLTDLKKAFDKRETDHGLKLANVLIYNKSGAATLKITINDRFGFFLRSERNGFKMYIPPEFRAGSYASFVFFHAMLEKVNIDILGLKLSPSFRLKINGKMKNLKQLKASNKRTKEIFDEFAGVKTFQVGGGISGIENYLRGQIQK